MDDEARGRVINDGERVGTMADVAGQTALYSVVDDREVLDELENGHARALWLFLNDLNRFRHAEEVRFTDERRRGRSWDGFICEANLNLRRDEIALNAFRAALRQRFASRNVHADIFERVRPTFEGEDCDLVQISVYREGLPDDQFAFDEGELVRRAYRPVFEAAMTYEPASRVIEVVANDRENRAEMAQYLARDLLGVEFRDEKVPMRRYDLTVLLALHAFPTDIEDGIERVEVRQLRLMPIDAVGERVTLGAMSKAEREHLDDGGGSAWPRQFPHRRLGGDAGEARDQVPAQARGSAWSHAAPDHQHAAWLQSEGSD